MGFISKQIIDAYKSILFTRHDPDGRIFYFSHTDFDGLIKKDFSFVTKKGYKLQGGFYYYPNPRLDRLVVFEHGLGVGHRAYMREIEMLASRGYLVFSYDHIGCSTSEGENVMGLSGSLVNLDECITALKRIPELSSLEISVMGHSRGGFSTMNILALHPDIHSIVAMSGFLSLEIMLRQIVPSVIAPIRKKIYQIECETNPDYAQSSAIEVLKNTDKPALIIHSDNDGTVSAKMNYFRLKKELSNKNNVDFILVNDKGHSPNYSKSAADYKRAFFKELNKRKKQKTLETEEQKADFVQSYDWRKMTEQDIELWNRIFDFLEK